ncbi:MAG: hypothetical protein IPO77_17985 [Acidobacteria bacterium]|nr:hypothetical protein [Acidobacteriota bacterium]
MGDAFLVFYLVSVTGAFFSTQPATIADELGKLLVIAGGYIALSAPFDFFGGYWLPRRFQRPALVFRSFVVAWLRGVLGQALVYVLAGFVILQAGHAGGRGGATLAVALLMIVLLFAQGWLAQMIGGLKPVAANLEKYRERLAGWAIRLPATTVMAAKDPAFVGGLIGMPGHERLVLPAAWFATNERKREAYNFPSATAALQMTRRVGVLARGSRRRGVLLALAWNLSGFALAAWLPTAGVSTAAELLTTACGFTLWSFWVCSILPSFSRPGVFEGDQYAWQHGVPRDLLEETIALVDKQQDDEPERRRWLEIIFHPIPSVNSRRQQLALAEPAPRGAWQAARMALFLSWGCLGLLSRAVHCNSGRPELWVLFPGD